MPNGYLNPYSDRRYGPALSATQGFLRGYNQYLAGATRMRALETMEEYRQSLQQINQMKVGALEAMSPEERSQALFPRARSTEISISVPGKYALGGDLKRAGLTPTAITESLENIPEYYTREQASEFLESSSLASAIGQKKFPTKGFWGAKWGGYDYPESEVLPVFRSYLQQRNYWNKTAAQQEAIKDAWKTTLGGEEPFAGHEVGFDWESEATKQTLARPLALEKKKRQPAFKNKADSFGYTVGETKTVGGTQWEYIGNNQWREL